jgi:hypothetical protein
LSAGDFSLVTREPLAHGIDAREPSLGDDDHFDAVLELNDPGSELTAALVAFATRS